MTPADDGQRLLRAAEAFGVARPLKPFDGFSIASGAPALLSCSSVMTLDHRGHAAVRAFSDEADGRLGRDGSGMGRWTLRLLGAWLVGGVPITLAILGDGAPSTALYLAAIAIVAVWVVSFYARAGQAHRYRG